MTRIFIAVVLTLSLVLWVGCGDEIISPFSAEESYSEENTIIDSEEFAYGQDNKLIYSINVANEAEKVKDILQKSIAYVSVNFVKIDLEKIMNSGPFTLQFGETNILITRTWVNSRGYDYYVFGGDHNNGDSILLSVFGNDILGVISTLNGVFSVMTVGMNEYVVVRVDQSKLKDGCEGI